MKIIKTILISTFLSLNFLGCAQSTGTTKLTNEATLVGAAVGVVGSWLFSKTEDNKRPRIEKNLILRQQSIDIQRFALDEYNQYLASRFDTRGRLSARNIDEIDRKIYADLNTLKRAQNDKGANRLIFITY